MTVGSLCNLNLQQFTSATFRGTKEREIYIYGCYGCRASDRIKTFIADRASMRIEEGKKKEKGRGGGMLWPRTNWYN